MERESRVCLGKNAYSKRLVWPNAGDPHPSLSLDEEGTKKRNTRPNRSGECEAYSFGLIAQQSAEADLIIELVERVHVR